MSIGSLTFARATSLRRRSVPDVRQVANLFRRRCPDTLPAVEAPAAAVVLAAGLAVPEVPGRLRIDRRHEEAEGGDAGCVDFVTGEHADSDDAEQEGDEGAGRLA